MATTPVSLIPQRVIATQPDKDGNQVFSKEVYRMIEALVKQVNDLQARLTAAGL